MSFQQGLSGLNAASKSLDVIGNNVANAGVAGFKGATAQFGDVFASSLGGGGGVGAVGIGAQLKAVAQQFSQGNITSTQNGMDIAINGNGFFRMSDNGNITFSRNGQFHLDKNGVIVNTNGQALTGYSADTSGNILASTLSPIAITTSTLAPNPTSAFTATMNLDARATAKPIALFDATLATSFTSSTSGVVFDDVGVSHTMTMYFLKDGSTTTGVAPTAITTGPGDISAGGIVINGTAIGAVVSPNTTAAAQGAAVAAAINAAAISGITASVDAAGIVTLDNTTNPAIATTITFPVVANMATLANTGLTAAVTPYSASGNWYTYGAIDGALTGGGLPVGVTVGANATGLSPLNFTTGLLTTPMPLTVSVDLNAVDAALGIANNATSPLVFTLDLSSSTQYGSTFSISTLTQDGYTSGTLSSSGQLSSIGISADGLVVGHYSNGQTQNMGQVVLATFANPNGLSSEGANQWKDNSESGLAVVGVPRSGVLGSLQSSAIEESNVDLTSELVAMITAQRIYQANAQSIKTQDSVLQTLVNLR